MLAEVQDRMMVDLAEEQVEPRPTVPPKSRPDNPLSDPLSDPLIKEFLANNRSYWGKIERAAEILKSREAPDLVPALRKVCKTLNGKVRVFFSYKIKESAIATEIIKCLKASTGELEIYWAEKFGFGDKWREQIEEGVRNANWFILLLPDKTVDDWDWCLYESGLFKAWMQSCDRLFCLYHPDVKEPPSQLEGFKAVKATVEEVENFLTEIFTENDVIPGRPALNPDADIKGMAKRICEAIKAPVETDHYDNHVILEIPDNGTELTPEQFEEARVLAAEGPDIRQIFGFSNTPRNWSELVRPLRQQMERAEPAKRAKALAWTDEIFAAVEQASRNLLPETTHSTFPALRGGKVYRPVLHRKQTWKHLKSQLRIIFVESTDRVVTEEVPLRLEVLATSMRFAYRFHWELIQPFAGKKHLAEDDFLTIGNTLKRLEDDAEKRGVVDPDLLAGQFEGRDATDIREMFEKWSKLRNKKDGKGKLDIALANRDGPCVLRVLSEFRVMNHQFLALAAKRFSDHMTECLVKQNEYGGAMR